MDLRNLQTKINISVPLTDDLPLYREVLPPARNALVSNTCTAASHTHTQNNVNSVADARKDRESYNVVPKDTCMSSGTRGRIEW